MGVPVMTRIGDLPHSRATWSILSNLGLTDLAGQNSDEFIQKAITLATDLPRLANLRSTLRARMRASPLMNARRFTQQIESAYRQMWQDQAHS
jgi:protein O-GlcNAc transferase